MEINVFLPDKIEGGKYYVTVMFVLQYVYHILYC